MFFEPFDKDKNIGMLSAISYQKKLKHREKKVSEVLLQMMNCK
jgi:hypothetical protein